MAHNGQNSRQDGNQHEDTRQDGSRHDGELPDPGPSDPCTHLLHALDVGVWTLDHEGRVVSANPAASHLCACATDELPGKLFTALWNGTLPREVLRVIRDHAEQGQNREHVGQNREHVGEHGELVEPRAVEPAASGVHAVHAASQEPAVEAEVEPAVQAEVDLYRRDGSVIPARVAVSAMTDAEHRRVGSVVTLTDLSEHRHREAALRDEVRRLGLLLKETHHRVKNNLQIIASLVAILAASEDEAPPWVDSLEQRVRAIAMVHETLYESSNYGDVNLNDYIRRMVDSSLTQAGLSASVHVSVDIASGRLSLAETIPVGIIVSEFLTNSIKYAFAGRSEGRLTIRESEGPDEVVELYYADDGPGISPERRENPRQGSVGMEIVEALTGQLGGELVLGDPRASRRR